MADGWGETRGRHARLDGLEAHLLRAQLVCVAALLLAAVGRLRVQAGVALAADHLLTVVLAGKDHERRLDDAAAEAEDQVESGLLLDVVVSQGAAILELLASKDEALRRQKQNRHQPLKVSTPAHLRALKPPHGAAASLAPA
eukprot:COSAG06_NODE_12652_length_1347_cov_1.212340_2_plen_142_part_00